MNTSEFLKIVQQLEYQRVNCSQQMVIPLEKFYDYLWRNHKPYANFPYNHKDIPEYMAKLREDTAYREAQREAMENRRKRLRKRKESYEE